MSRHSKSLFCYSTDPNATVINHEMRIHEINTLDWDELGIPNDSNKLITSGGTELLSVYSY